MTIQMHPNVPRERLDAAETVMRLCGGTHLIPCIRAVRDHGCASISIVQRSPRFDLPPVTKPLIVIIGDDVWTALGPDGFHKPSLKGLLKLCSVGAIIPGRPVLDAYTAIAAAAAADRRNAVLIETRSNREQEWKDFLFSANPRVEMVEALAPRSKQ